MRKIFIVGYHSSGKDEIAEDLRSMGLRVGTLFNNLPDTNDPTQYGMNQLHYTNNDIHEIFENKAFVFLHEIHESVKPYYEGLTFHEYQNNDIFVVSPNQLNSISNIPDDIVYVWLDNNLQNRKSRYQDEKRKYNFKLQDEIEKKNTEDFLNIIYANNKNGALLYFFNEDPKRVSAIVASIYLHTDLLAIYKTRLK